MGTANEAEAAAAWPKAEAGAEGGPPGAPKAGAEGGPPGAPKAGAIAPVLGIGEADCMKQIKKICKVTRDLSKNHSDQHLVDRGGRSELCPGDGGLCMVVTPV